MKQYLLLKYNIFDVSVELNYHFQEKQYLHHELNSIDCQIITVNK